MSEKTTQKKIQQAIDAGDLDYIRSTQAALLLQTPKSSRALLYIIVGFISMLLIWSAFAELDEVTRGHGKVIPSRKVQVIQNLEGGIVAEILVKEGQVVNKGQVLLRIDDNSFESTFMSNRLRYLEMLAQAARLKAESSGKKKIDMPEEVLQEHPEMAKNAQKLFEAHLKGLKNSLKVIRHQTLKSKQELNEARQKLKQLKKNLTLAKKEMAIIKPLFKKGAVSEVKLIQAERQVYNFEAQYNEVKTSLPRLKTNIQESQEKEKELISNFQSKAREELNKILAEIPRVKESGKSLKDKLTRTSVRSPVKGTVKQLLVNTIDGVVKPGMDLVQIVPLDDSLIVEAKIKPSDIAYIHPQQKAKVRITAYDSSKYGSLDAEVFYISADSIKDEETNQPFYLVRVKTDKNYLQSKGKQLPIIPGMIAEVDILTGKKTVLEYFLKPLLRAKDNALIER